MKALVKDNAKRYSKRRPLRGKPWDRRVQSAVGMLEGEEISNILDVGVGNGDFLRFLPRKIKKYAVDLVEPGEMAKEMGFVFRRANVEEGLPFRSGFFEAVFAGDIIEHLYDTDAFVGECSRVLKEGGILILTTPNICSLNNLVSILQQRQPFAVNFERGNYEHIRYYCLPSLRKQLLRHGMSIEKVAGNYVYLPFWSKRQFILGLSARLAGVFPQFAKHIIVKARKGQAP